MDTNYNVNVHVGIKTKICTDCLIEIIERLEQENSEEHSNSFRAGINTAIEIIQSML